MLISRKGLRRVREEIDALEQRAAELAEEAGLQAQAGGNVWHDNFGWDETQKDKGIVAGRIEELQLLAGRAELIDDLPWHGDSIQPGCTVTLRWAEGDEEEFTVLGSFEAKPEEGIVSNQSPIGQALIGKCAGVQVAVGSSTAEIVGFRRWEGLEA